MTDRSRQDDRDIDRMALDGEKTEWQERTQPAAGDPVTDDERRALNIVAQNDPRGGDSIEGVSDPKREDVPIRDR